METRQAKHHAADVVAVCPLELTPARRRNSYNLSACIGRFTTATSLKTFLHEIDDLEAGPNMCKKKGGGGGGATIIVQSQSYGGCDLDLKSIQ